ASCAEMARELDRLRHPVTAASPSRSRTILAAAVTATLILALAGWWARQESNRRWAREKALPEAMRLAEQGSYVASFDLAQKVHRSIPSDPILGKLLADVSSTIELDTVPAGARVRYMEYADPNGPWSEL